MARRVHALLLGLALVGAACSVQVGAVEQTPPVQFVRPVASLAVPQLAGAIEAIKELSSSWNDNQIRWIAALQDPSVSYEAFLRTQQDVLIRQARVVTELALEVSALPAKLQPAFAPFVDHYSKRLELLKTVFGAATATDQEFQRALGAYTSFVEAEAITVIRGFFLDPEVEAAFAAEGVDSQEALDAFLRAVGSS